MALEQLGTLKPDFAEETLKKLVLSTYKSSIRAAIEHVGFAVIQIYDLRGTVSTPGVVGFMNNAEADVEIMPVVVSSIFSLIPSPFSPFSFFLFFGGGKRDTCHVGSEQHQRKLVEHEGSKMKEMEGGTWKNRFTPAQIQEVKRHEGGK